MYRGFRPSPRACDGNTSPGLADIMEVLDNEDLRQEIFSQFRCTLTLRRARAVCREWCVHLASGKAQSIWRGAWLKVPVRSETGAVLLTAEHALGHAPAGEQILIAQGTRLYGDLRIPHPVHITCQEGVQLYGRLVLGAAHSRRLREDELDALVSDDAAHAFEIYETLGVIQNLECIHYDVEAVSVIGGAWRLAQCTVGSAKRTRASTAMVIRAKCALGLVECTISNAKHGVCLERANCSLKMVDCVFTNVKDGAVLTCGGGEVVSQGCAFQRMETALTVDRNVRGHITDSVFGSDVSVFGRWARPQGFRVYKNTYLDGLAQLLEAEEEASQPDGGEAGAAEVQPPQEETVETIEGGEPMPMLPASQPLPRPLERVAADACVEPADAYVEQADACVEQPAAHVRSVQAGPVLVGRLASGGSSSGSAGSSSDHACDGSSSEPLAATPNGQAQASSPPQILNPAPLDGGLPMISSPPLSGRGKAPMPGLAGGRDTTTGGRGGHTTVRGLRKLCGTPGCDQFDCHLGPCGVAVADAGAPTSAKRSRTLSAKALFHLVRAD